MFQSYLKTVDHCEVCNEAYHHHRADDGPAYLTILVVAHMVGFALPLFYELGDPSPITVALIISVLASALSLVLLPRIKGAFVALQWSKKMHGFKLEESVTPEL